MTGEQRATRRIDDFWLAPDDVAVSIVHEPSYRQVPAEEMLDRAADSLAAWDAPTVNTPPTFFPDFGTVTMAKPWGGELLLQDNGEVFINPVAKDIDRILDIEPGENPDIQPAVEMFRALRDRTGREDLLFRTPDFQGVLNTAALIMQQDELMMAMYEQPEKVHRFLDIVCDRNIQTMRDLLAGAGRVDGNIWPYVWLPHRLGVMLTEDMMPLLSPELFKEFGLPRLKRISDAFGGVFIHCCGQWARHAANLAESGVTIRGVEFHFPFTPLEEIEDHFPDTVLVPFLADFNKTVYEDFPSYVEALLDARKPRTKLCLALTDTQPDLPAVLEVLNRRGVTPVRYVE